MIKMLQLLLTGSAVLLTVACSSAVNSSAKQTPAAPEAPPVVEQQEQAATLMAIRAESQPVPRLILRTSGTPAYSSYSPQPDVFVVDLPRAVKAAGLSLPGDLPQFIASISADEAVELGARLTRVTVRFTRPTTVETSALDDSVILAFNAVPSAASTLDASASSMDADVAARETEAEVIIADIPVEQPAAAKPVSARNSKPSSGRKATILKGVTTAGSGEDLRITLDTNGAVEYSSFKLTNPLRIVLDLKNIQNKTTGKSVQLGDPYVSRIRISQFQGAPKPITRVVLDLDEIVQYQVAQVSDKLLVYFGDPRPELSDTAEESLAVTEPRSESALVSHKPLAPATTVSVSSARIEASDLEATDRVAVIPSAPAPSVFEPIAQHVVNSALDQEPPPVQTTTPRNLGGDNVFVDATTRPSSGGSLTPGGSRTLSGGDQIWTGEPIDLRLKDADIKDVLRTFAQLTGLNIAIDPNVTGNVTVEFEDVPWDQALDLILRQNGLTWVREGNVLRVGTVDRLAAEQAQTRRLEEEERLNVALQTVIKRLSYAKAADVSTLIKDVASPRGKVIVDPRTNQLVVTDVPEYMDTILRLIENIDIPTPQVVIEARIVETTKNFLRNLGINWGFNADLDPALGTGTGLAFPNRVGIIGGPFGLTAGAPNVIRFTLSNVLGTFDLDFALTAAENEGLARIVSAPKVTTQDNQQAEIQSGVQIPIQTRVNFTTTVQYIDATLRLTVTPQITAEDTVIMDIQVSKTQPAVALAVVGAQNAPLLTRRAITRVMVRDGGTTVIGGIYQASEDRGQDRIPYLHQIPVLGNLFKNNRYQTSHDELLIFITPKIVRNT